MNDYEKIKKDREVLLNCLLKMCDIDSESDVTDFISAYKEMLEEGALPLSYSERVAMNTMLNALAEVTK